MSEDDEERKQRYMRRMEGRMESFVAHPDSGHIQETKTGIRHVRVGEDL